MVKSTDCSGFIKGNMDVLVNKMQSIASLPIGYALTSRFYGYSFAYCCSFLGFAEDGDT